MARLLVGSGDFDHFVAVAPEGHVYGYFLERLGAKVLSVLVDYPPTRCDSTDELSVLRGGRVLVVEDDVIGGRTLRLVVEHLKRFGPASLSLYLGHTKGIQRLQNVPGEIETTFLAEDRLDWTRRDEDERAFMEFFGR
jgi:hypoxanthine phosphoribosyltransferase